VESVTAQANNFKVFEAHMTLHLLFELPAENGSKTSCNVLFSATKILIAEWYVTRSLSHCKWDVSLIANQRICLQ